MIQTCIKYGDPTQRSTIISELKNSIVELAGHEYSSFLIKKMLKYGTKDQRAEIIKAFRGKVRSCLAHKVAAASVEGISLPLFCSQLSFMMLGYVLIQKTSVTPLQMHIRMVILKSAAHSWKSSMALNMCTLKSHTSAH